MSVFPLCESMKKKFSLRKKNSVLSKIRQKWFSLSRSRRGWKVGAPLGEPQQCGGWWVRPALSAGTAADPGGRWAGLQGPSGRRD